jgi:hypothetical protein
MNERIAVKTAIKLCIVLTVLILLVSINFSRRSVICTLEARPGLIIEVTDAATGTSLDKAAGTVAEGSSQEPLQGFAGTLFGAFEQPGKYQVFVASPGYRTWTSTEIQVRAGMCHVETVRVRAPLIRE